MEMKQLKMFQTAAIELNFTKTAQILGYAQSSITGNIYALEEEIGAPLFERLGRRVFLTKAGEQLLDYADKILGLTEEAVYVTGGKNQNPGGMLRICASETHCTYRLPHILKAFQEKYPNIELIFRPAVAEKDILHLLSEGQIDVGLLSMHPLTSSSFTVKELKEEPVALISNPAHPLRDKGGVTPYDVAQEKLLLTEACDYRTSFENALIQSGTAPNSKLEIGDISAIKECVKAGLGVAVLPEIAVQKEIADKTISKLNWNGPAFNIQQQLFWHKNKWMSPALQAFITLTEEYIKENG
ncbi:LysR family transcriptional regulator [Halobacillus kuroshimensis]|uniref:LysR family transcriptional regulator n=1 Tax=Halobacillus kuroshimensis TaxID=302481 RepID=UPI00041820B4|nr:LysR family transcriptional regulator [Halobacillus kuroshimensis]